MPIYVLVVRSLFDSRTWSEYYYISYGSSKGIWLFHFFFFHKQATAPATTTRDKPPASGVPNLARLRNAYWAPEGKHRK
jgi:hypothetical protein